jgi:mono/diheme cytochrome c family protein
MIWVSLLFWWAQTTVPQQVQRGGALFLETSKGCVNCHSLKGHGTAVGPDLSVIGRLSPAAIVTGIRSSATQYVETVRLNPGEAFPGMAAGAEGSILKYYDVSKMPPELRRIEKSDLKMTVSQDAWKHPPSVGNYTKEQVADVVAYIRYAVTGNIKPIDPADLE